MAEITTVVTSIFATATSAITFIVAEPMLLIPVALGLVGGAIGIFKKLT